MHCMLKNLQISALSAMGEFVMTSAIQCTYHLGTQSIFSGATGKQILDRSFNLALLNILCQID